MPGGVVRGGSNPASNLIGVYPLSASHHRSDVFFYGADRLDVKVLNEHFGHSRRQESGQRRTKTNAFDAKIQQSQQYGYGLLLVPSDIIRDRQVVDVIETEDLL